MRKLFKLQVKGKERQLCRHRAEGRISRKLRLEVGWACVRSRKKDQRRECGRDRVQPESRPDSRKDRTKSSVARTLDFTPRAASEKPLKGFKRREDMTQLTLRDGHAGRLVGSRRRSKEAGLVRGHRGTWAKEVEACWLLAGGEKDADMFGVGQAGGMEDGTALSRCQPPSCRAGRCKILLPAPHQAHTQLSLDVTLDFSRLQS